jgi:hypothetical protein
MPVTRISPTGPPIPSSLLSTHHPENAHDSVLSHNDFRETVIIDIRRDDVSDTGPSSTNVEVPLFNERIPVDGSNGICFCHQDLKNGLITRRPDLAYVAEYAKKLKFWNGSDWQSTPYLRLGNGGASQRQ